MSAPNIVAGWIAAAVKVERERYEPCVEALREIANIRGSNFQCICITGIEGRCIHRIAAEALAKVGR